MRKVLEHQLQNPEIRFGRAAVELGLLDEADVERLARDQLGSAMHIDEAIAKVLACEPDQVAELRARFEEQP